MLERAEQNLTNARSDRASAKAASLITRVDAPDTGTSPVSPSGLMIVLGGMLGGLLTGFGLVLLTAPATAAADAAAAREDSKAAPAPYAGPIPQHATPVAPIREPWSLTVAAHGSLNCTQALKVLNEQGKLT